MHYYSFEKLEAWQLVRTLISKIYHLTSGFPKDEAFGLTSQLRRSVSSIGACLAEGSARTSMKDKAHFSNLAYSTAIETLHHLLIALDLDYIDKKTLLEVRIEIEKITIKISALRNAQTRLIKSRNQLRTIPNP